MMHAMKSIFMSELLGFPQEAGTVEQLRHENMNRSIFISDDLIYLWTSIPALIFHTQSSHAAWPSRGMQGGGRADALSFPRQAARVEMRETTRHAAGFGVFSCSRSRLTARGRPAHDDGRPGCS